MPITIALRRWEILWGGRGAGAPAVHEEGVCQADTVSRRVACPGHGTSSGLASSSWGLGHVSMVNSWKGAKGSLGPIRQDLELEWSPAVTKIEVWGKGLICSVPPYCHLPSLATGSVLRRLPTALCLP